APQSTLWAPLIVGGEPAGVVSVQNLDREHAFHDSDVGLLVSLAASLSVSIETAGLVSETRRRADEMSALADVARGVSATLDVSAVLGRVTGQARALLDASTSAVFLPDGDGTFRAITAVGANAEEILADTIRVGEGIIGGAAAERAPQLVNDVAAD